MKEEGNVVGCLVATQGLLSIIFGIVIFAWPGLTLAIFIYAYAFYLLINGLVGFFHSFSSRKTNSAWWVYLLDAILSIIIGLAILFWPGITALVVVYIVAAWAMIAGILKVLLMFASGQDFADRLFSLILGIILVVFSVFLFVNPGKGVLALVNLIALFSILYGVLLFFLAFVVRRYAAEADKELEEKGK